MNAPGRQRLPARPIGLSLQASTNGRRGSYIEPSVAHGGHYLGLTAAWSTSFKSGGARPLAASAVNAAASTSTHPGTIVHTNSLPRTGCTDGLHTNSLAQSARRSRHRTLCDLGQVTENQAVPIMGRNADESWWLVQAGETAAWISANYVYAAGPLTTVPIVTEVTSREAEEAPSSNNVTISTSASMTSPLQSAAINEARVIIDANPSTNGDAGDYIDPHTNARRYNLSAQTVARSLIHIGRRYHGGK